MIFFILMAILLLGIVIAGAVVWFQRWITVLKIPKSDIYIRENLKAHADLELPFVSILVPARNEEENISECIYSLLKQDYPDFEIIVINDRSTDRTLEILKNFPGQDKIKIINISELPGGWTGKTHALHEGSKIAKGEWLLFTDADTIHNSSSLRSSITYALDRNIELLSLYPQSKGNSFWEKITQPLGGGILHIWHPFEKVNNPECKTAFANGQFILITKKCYSEIGGHEKVKKELLEDVAMAEAAKAKAKNIRMCYGFNLFSIRMYKGIPQIWKGWRRIFGVLMGKKKSRYPGGLFLIIFFSFVPFLLLFKVSFLDRGGIWTLIYLIDILEIIFLYLAISSLYMLSRDNPLWGIFYPAGCFIMFCIILDALIRELFHKPVSWRGTLYPSA